MKPLDGKEIGTNEGSLSGILLELRKSPGLKLISDDPAEYVRFNTVDGSPMTASSGGTVLAEAAVAAVANAERARVRRIVTRK